MNAAIFGRNWVLDGDINASSELGDHKVANLKNSLPGRIHRSNSDKELTIWGDFGGHQRSVDGFALAGHNLAFDTEIKLELFYNDNLIEMDSFNAVDPIYGLGEGPITWNIGGYDDDVRGQTFIARAYTGIAATRYKLTITSTDKIEKEAWYLYLGERFSPLMNVYRDPSITVIDPTEWIETESQSIRIRPRKTYREMTMSWGFMNQQEVVKFIELCRQVGRRQIVLVMLHPGKNESIERETSFLAWMEWSEQRRRLDSREEFYSVDLVFKEAI